MNTYTQTCACVCNHTHTNKIKMPYLSSPKYQNTFWNEHKHATCYCVCNHLHTNKIKRPYLSSPKYQNASWNEYIHATCAYVCNHIHSNKNKNALPIKSVCVGTHRQQQNQYFTTLRRYVMTKIGTIGSWATTRFHTLVDKTSKEVFSIESRAVPLQVPKLSLAVNYRLSCSP